MKERLGTLLLALWATALFSQATPTYYDDIKPILDKNCVVCHRQGEAVPFTLETYEDVSKRATFIKTVVRNRYMPPWFADNEFRSFHNERRLSDEEIAAVAAWVDGGKPAGRKPRAKIEALAERPFPAPDLELRMQPFTIPGDNTEQFRFFVIPTNTKEELYVRGVEFQPGNLELAHHARLMLDTTHLLRPDNGARAGDPNTEFTRLNIQLTDAFWHGWVPGNFTYLYPDGIGRRLPKDADIILNMHYSPSPREASDQSTIRLYLCPEKPRRIIESFVLDESWVVNQPFFLPANTTVKFTMRSPMLKDDISLVSVLPHMHLLGRSFKAYAITPKGDIVFLIKIDDWNFNWQMTYQFERLLRLPKGTVIYAEAVYDNTENNPRNPHYPPRDVRYGWGTYDEMMNLIFEFLPYEEGDEKLDLYAKQER